MSDYKAPSEEEQNKRNPKNRFLGLFCHASEVNDYWGYNWPFWCGVLLFGIVIGFMTFFDIFFVMGTFSILSGWFLFWFIIRFFSDLVALIGIALAGFSICGTDFTKATVSYYLMCLSLLCNTLFCFYCIFKLFDKEFWSKTTYKIIVWLFNEFVLFLFCWILFCNMVHIGRKRRHQAATNNF